jgi:hypothetical protein
MMWPVRQLRKLRRASIIGIAMGKAKSETRTQKIVLLANASTPLLLFPMCRAATPPRNRPESQQHWYQADLQEAIRLQVVVVPEWQWPWCLYCWC